MDDAPLLFHLGTKAFVPSDPSGDGQALFVTPSFRVSRRNGFRLAPSGAEVTVDGKPAGPDAPLTHRALIVTADRQAYVFLERPDPGLATPDDLADWALAMVVRGAEEERTRGVPGAGAAPLPELPGAVPLRRGANLVGRDQDADVQLPFPLVSRRHARIEVGSDGATVTDLGSFNGTFVNGERVRHSSRLLPGDRIDVGPVRLIFTGDALLVRSSSDAVEIVLDAATRSVPVPGGDKVLVNAASLVIRPREFVAILGPSGCGKSILLKLIGGRLPATKGGVYINRESLARGSEPLKKLIAYVPQRDVLHESLRLGDALGYSARLRLPEDLNATERQTAVDEVTRDVGLERHVATRIASLSGGQTRRASVANEMLSRPGLLLLDEVTSGLDEKTDGELMRLFRQLADAGKTIVCVTHNLGHVAETCHHVAVLAPGGSLAYFGPPAEALRYFGVASLGEVYGAVESKPPAEWRSRYETHPDRERFIASRTPVVLSTTAGGGSGRTAWQRTRAAFRQFLLMSRRAAAVKAAQPRWLALTAVQCVGLALLLGWLFGNLATVSLTEDERANLKRAPELIGGLGPDDLADMPPFFRAPVEQRLEQSQETSEKRWVVQKRGTLTLRLLVALVMCTLWLGCNNASAEIVGERSVFESERDVGLSVAAYLGSKVLLLGLVTAAQTAVLLFGVRWVTYVVGPPGWQFALLGAVGLVGVLLGLAISAWSRTTEVSTALVPLALIPQILFAGSLVPISGLRQTVAEWLVPMHWGYRGLVSQLTFTDDDRSLLGMVGSLPEYPASDNWIPWAVLAAHGLLLLAACWLGLRDANPTAVWKRLRKRPA